jgi:hypothetical protein
VRFLHYVPVYSVPGTKSPTIIFLTGTYRYHNTGIVSAKKCPRARHHRCDTSDTVPGNIL